MDFYSLYNSLKTQIRSMDDVSKFISDLNLVPLSVRISLAKGIVDFMETNPLINETLLKSLGISWSPDDINNTRAKIATIEQAAETKPLGGDPEVYPYTGQYLETTTGAQTTGGAAQSAKDSDGSTQVPGGEILWNVWLTRTLKAATLIIACVALAIIGYIVYQKWDVLKDKLGVFGETISQWFGNLTGSNKKINGLGYPFEADATLLKEASINFTLLRFLAEVFGVTEERALHVVRAVKEIDVELVRNFLEMEKRVSDVRSIGKRPVASAISYVSE